MKKRLMILTVAVTAAMLTACGNGGGVVINGTTAAGVESVPEGGSEEGAKEAGQGESKGSTRIEIITGETQPAEPGAESLEGQTDVQETQAQTAAPATAAPQTTAAPTAPTAAPTAAPTTAAPTTAAAQYKVTDVKKNMYATSSVRVRGSYSTSSEVLGALAEGEKVEVTGESSNGWMRVNYKGHVAYVSKSYLTDTQPSTAANTTTTESNHTSKPSTATNNGTTPGGTTGPAGPTGGTASNGPTSPGQTTGPAGPTSSGGTTSPGGAASSGGTSASGNKSSVNGTVTALDPTGVTIQTSDGTSYQFVWGDNPPDLSVGEKAQVQYVLDGSGQRQITQVTK